MEPLALKLLLGALMAASLAAAVLAPAPGAKARGETILRLAALPVTFHATALLALVGGRTALATAALVAAVEASCYLTWLSRGEGGDDGGGGGGPGDDSLPPPDWDAFDRARAAWARTPWPRVPV